VIRIALGRVVDVATDETDVLLHGSSRSSRGTA
jgi:hypothetical protein